ncbi:MAG: glycosyl transferase [Clostridia bacterium]|nr:glycosyl transferase [Clostridia bacterium]
MIPKILHYCWFGGAEKTKLQKKCIESWKKHCPDYEIIEWNEKNFDVNCNAYCKEMYRNKKWAFLSDYARLKIIYDNGGIYIDTDVELLKSFDDLLYKDAFMGEEQTGRIATGLSFGAVKGHYAIKENAEYYEKQSIPSTAICVDITTDIFKKYGYIGCDKTPVLINGVMIYPEEYFCPYSYFTGEKNITKNTYSVHHYEGSWESDEKKKKHKKEIRKEKIERRIDYIKHIPNRLIRKLLGKKRYKKLKDSVKKSP